MPAQLPKVGILLTNIKYVDLLEPGIRRLLDLGIEVDVRGLNAFSTSYEAQGYARLALEDGFDVIIAADDRGGQLAATLATFTVIPVIAVPLAEVKTDGMPVLYETLDTPGEVPVCGVGVNGVMNACMLAAEILGVRNRGLQTVLRQQRNIINDRGLRADAEVIFAARKMIREIKAEKHNEDV